MKAQIPWLRVFVEGVVIVGSILLAFGLQAWWDGVQERQEEQRVLAALAEDFEETRVDTRQKIAATEAVRDTVMRLLELGSMEQPDVAREEIRQLLRGAFGLYDLEPQISTYEDIVGSGNLRLIRSERLRIAMAQLVKDLEGAHDALEIIRQRWMRLEEPYLVRHFAFAEIFWDYRDVGLVFKARDVLDDLEIVLELINGETAR